MKKSLIAAAFAAACLVALPAQAYSAGEWVLAQWKGESYWFPGVVKATTGSTVTVAYDDGSEETRPANQVKPYDWRAGSTVECRWKGGTEWYRGTIAQAAADGVTIAVKYEDGDSETTKTGACRSR